MTTLELLKNQISELSSTDFLTLVQEECAKRKVDRDKIKGGNDIEINKIHMLLTDQFWMREIFVILWNGSYQGFKLKESEAKDDVDNYNEHYGHRTYMGASDRATYKREIVDLRDIY